MLNVVGIVESVCVVRVVESVVEAGYVTIVEESRLVEVIERVAAVVEVLRQRGFHHSQEARQGWLPSRRTRGDPGTAEAN